MITYTNHIPCNSFYISLNAQKPNILNIMRLFLMWKTGKDHIIKFMMGFFSTKIFVKIYKNWSITNERLSQAKITQWTVQQRL